MKGSGRPRPWKAWRSWNPPSKRMAAPQQVSSSVTFVSFRWFICLIINVLRQKKVLTDLLQQATPARSVMEQLLFSWQNAPERHSWGSRCWGCSGPSPWSESRPTLWASARPTPSPRPWRRQVRTARRLYDGKSDPVGWNLRFCY